MKKTTKKTKPQWSILVDSAEPSDLKKYFKERGEKEKDLFVEISNNEVGDFWICNPSGDVVAVVERKTHADLSHSMTDGRFTEQRERMQLLENAHKGKVDLVFVMEESKLFVNMSSNGRKSVELIRAKNKAAEMSLLCRGFIVFHVENYKDIFDHMKTLIRISKERIENKAFESTYGVSKIIVKNMCCKPKLKTPELAVAAFVGCISGVSETKAMNIQKEYKTIPQLIEALKSKGPHALARKMSVRNESKLSERIHNMLLPPLKCPDAPKADKSCKGSLERKRKREEANQVDDEFYLQSLKSMTEQKNNSKKATGKAKKSKTQLQTVTTHPKYIDLRSTETLECS